MSEATPATPATSPTADQVLQTLADTLGFDAVTALKGTLAATAANIKANPTSLNAGVQFAALLPQFIAVGPALETDGIQGGATALEQLINLIPTPTVPAA